MQICLVLTVLQTVTARFASPGGPAQGVHAYGFTSNAPTSHTESLGLGSACVTASRYRNSTVIVCVGPSQKSVSTPPHPSLGVHGRSIAASFAPRLQLLPLQRMSPLTQNSSTSGRARAFDADFFEAARHTGAGP
jgi:hypothetical protein